MYDQTEVSRKARGLATPMPRCELNRLGLLASWPAWSQAVIDAPR